MIAKDKLINKVITVNGIVNPDTLGIVLPHEHLIVQGWDHKEINYFNSAFMELTQFVENDGKTIVDVTSIGQERDVVFIKKLAEHTGFQLIVGTGFYKEAWLPAEIRSMQIEGLSELMTKEITEGIESTNIQAGIIGEIGISRKITEFEEKVLEASAKTQKSTGVAISLHFDIGTSLSEYIQAIEILKNARANLSKVIIGHLIPRPDNLDIFLEIAKYGCFLEFDLFGQEKRLHMKDLIQTDVDVQSSSIRGFIHFGLLNQILISQNVNHIDLMTVNSGMGYGHILANVIPKMNDQGVTAEEIQTIMVENTKRALTIEEA